jgi:hypothetical protein
MKLPKIPEARTLLPISAVLTLIGLGLMAWSMLDPTVWPIMIAMSVGQVVGTSAFAIYIFCVLREFRRGRAMASPPPSPAQDVRETGESSTP